MSGHGSFSQPFFFQRKECEAPGESGGGRHVPKDARKVRTGTPHRWIMSPLRLFYLHVMSKAVSLYFQFVFHPSVIAFLSLSRQYSLGRSIKRKRSMPAIGSATLAATAG
jgi:hypothetical protein